MTPETADEVVNLLYRAILRRTADPAGHANFTALLLKGGSIADLVRIFIESPEYCGKRLSPHAPTPLRPFVPLGSAPMTVECRASPAELASLIERVGAAWAKLGREQPYFSVITGEEFLSGNLTDVSIERFWGSGKDEAIEIEAILARHGLSNLSGLTCVEYGCGLGRVTQPLATVFKQVHAYDISLPHIMLAREWAARYDNIDFHQVTSDIFGVDVHPCDFFYSRLVFQHNPPPVIAELIRLSLRALRPGGVAVFQVPTYATDYSFKIKDYLADNDTENMEMHFIPQTEVIRLIAEADCRLLEIREDGSIGMLGHWISNTFIVQN